MPIDSSVVEANEIWFLFTRKRGCRILEDFDLFGDEERISMKTARCRID